MLCLPSNRKLRRQIIFQYTLTGLIFVNMVRSCSKNFRITAQAGETSQILAQPSGSSHSWLSRNDAFVSFMMACRLSAFIIVLSLLYGCGKNRPAQLAGPNLPSFKSIKIDSVLLDPPAFSGVGFFEMKNDTILFFDKRFGTVSKFDLTGKYLGRSLGLGEGPQEIASITHAAELADGSYFILEVVWIFNLFTEDWRKVKRKNIRWNETASLKEMEESPRGEMTGIYEIEYETRPKAIGKDQVVVGITTDHPRFNSYFTDGYYRDARVFAILDINTGDVLEIIGRRPEVYLQKKYIPNFDVVHFDIDAEHILATFEADSLVYVIDRKGNVTASFGRRGRDMNTEYALTSSFDDAEAQIVRDRKKYGYYTDVKYLPEAGLVVRSYQRGSHVRYDGLQVYRDKELVGDFDVPKGTRVIGYSNGRAVAEGIKDERNNRLGYYLLTFL